MFENKKELYKTKILLKLKDRILYYTIEESNYNKRGNAWRTKQYIPKEKQQSYTQEIFEKEKEEQIKFSYDQEIINYHKKNALIEIQSIIDSITE